MKRFFATLLSGFVLLGCQAEPTKDPSNHIHKVYGKWLTETNGETILNPQSSGLTVVNGKLVTLSDRSAHPSQRLKLRSINPKTTKLEGPDYPIQLSDAAKQSCFADYVADNPDLEALVVDPSNNKIFYTVTEDASYQSDMPPSCQQRFKDSGATDYPRLLVKMQVTDNKIALVTHIKPLKFTPEMEIGNFPNDGIEGLVFGKNHVLYLGVERDIQKRPRIFSLQLSEQFWANDDFATVSEVNVQLPKFKSGNHPVNGMAYVERKNGSEYLLLAARNDQELWVTDLSGDTPTKIVPLEFYAEIVNGTGVCKDFEPMDNSSIEGLAVIDNTLWMINDPWKAVYLNNIRCPQNKLNYRNFASLLFGLTIQDNWFTAN